MQDQQLDIEGVLSVWNRLNNVDLLNVIPRHVPQRGAGLVADRDLNHDNTALPPALARIPRDLVLSHRSVEEFTKVDGHFRELLDVAGRKVRSRPIAPLCSGLGTNGNRQDKTITSYHGLYGLNSR